MFNFIGSLVLNDALRLVGFVVFVILINGVARNVPKIGLVFFITVMLFSYHLATFAAVKCADVSLIAIFFILILTYCIVGIAGCFNRLIDGKPRKVD